jgi:teichuronic acid exporter
MAQSNKFLSSVAVLFTGTLIAQAFTYLLAPIITRQYTPEETAYLGLFLRITALGAAIATARLELAFPLEKRDDHAFGIFRFSMRFSLLISAIALIFLLVYAGIDFTGIEQMLFWLSLPLGIFGVALYNQGASWELRKARFGNISRAALTQSVVTNTLKVVLGLWTGSFLALIAATLTGLLASNLNFVRHFLKNKKEALLKPASKRTRALVLKNADLYKYNLPHVFVDLARDLVIASVIWSLYGKSIYGSYDHAFRMLKLPIVFIGAAIGQVFFRRCTQLLHEQQSLFPLAFRTVLVLAGLSILPFVLIAVAGPQLFTFVFGDNWREAGIFAAIMVPWLLINFLSSPISHLPVLLNRQRTFFWLNLAGTVLLLLVVSIPYWGIRDFPLTYILQLLSISQAVFLAFILGWMLWIAKKGPLRA